MRLPFPEHIPLRYAVYFAALLCIAQLVQGTSASFSLCSFLFIVVATVAFNLAGGLTRPSGAYVFFYAILAVIFGLFWKVFLGEPADSNLTRPLLTMEASLGCITGLLMAVYLSRIFTRKRPLLGNMLTDANMLNASIGCTIIGVAITVMLSIVPFQGGSLLSALAQLNRFLPLAIILGVIYQIRKSGGTSSVNLPVLVSGSVIFISGVIGFSKEGMFTPLFCWLIPAASQRYRISFYQVIGFVLAAAFMVYYLTPYAQYGRTFRSDTSTLTENVDTALSLLSNLDYVRQQYEQNVEDRTEDRIVGYYNSPQGLFDRLQMLSMDDALINVTEENGPLGFWPVALQFEGLVPHALWPGKPTYSFGNIYAHEIGMVGDEDTTTGISFSPTAEAFHLGRWAGLFILAPILWIMLFTLYDSLCGDVRKYPWGLLAVVAFAHVAPEGMLGGVMYMMWFGAAGIVFVALTASYLLPLVGALFIGSQRTGLRRVAPIRSIPSHMPAVQPSQESSQ